MRWGRRILGWVWVASVAASTLLFVAAVGMWGRSYWITDWIERSSSTDSSYIAWGVSSSTGSVEVHREKGLALPPPFTSWDSGSQSSPSRLFPAESSLGFAFGTYNTPAHWIGPRDGSYVAIPHWFIALLSLPLPLIAIRRWRKKRRFAREGLCPVCGYDLRASVERCPECGTAIEARSVAS